MRSVLTAILAALAQFAFASMASAAPVVILAGDAGGAGPGSIVDDSLVVSLPAGASLMFNDANGQTRTLQGPYDGPIGATANTGAQSSGLDRLIAARKAEQSRLGAIRAAPGQTPRDSTLISVTQSATQCVRHGAKPRLWRPATMDADSAIRIANADGAVAELAWHAGQQTLDWPTAPEAVSGQRYLIELGIAPRAVEIVLHLAPKAFATDAALAAWMGDMGCRRQALAILDGLPGRS